MMLSLDVSGGEDKVWCCKKQQWIGTWNIQFSSVAQLCLTLCDPMNCSPPDFSVHGILQARILEWIAIPFTRRSSRPRDWTRVSCTAGRFFTIWTTKEALWKLRNLLWELKGDIAVQNPPSSFLESLDKLIIKLLLLLSLNKFLTLVVY